ncbi:ubiquitin-conjugating enzyme [Verticillium dahliae VdLs.17]|uniref:Ubiquitin-conjugating enzyme n=2 Tax=Verticillium dahliae TaxID=27337 RepID=G2XDS7_VERDV|nr:ubiquitin-conjugating enzyme [Verticillium dahliae VdLs.17]EGY17975.1 ubiquitin-conjugating enzyme [Verticillium dahliae VdLs.17]KAH6698711.1 ubiquitin-conjugating enzyme [Verticillium dahliae]
MATPKFNSKSPTIRRILKEAAELSKAPSPDYTATPLESDLFEWHFTFRGPPNSAFAEGIYHGRIVLPPTYPLRPPSFRFTTPSGRFEVNREICLSISGHHEETWQPAWGVRTALVALRSFMETDPKGQLGGLESTDAVRQRHALASRSFKCPACGKSNEEIMAESKNAADAAASTSSQAPSGVEVPSELKMAWKDEMTKSPETRSHAPAIAEQRHFGPGTTGLAEASDEESAELSEAFVTTGSVTPRRDNASTQQQMTAQEMAVPEISSYHHSESARVIPATARVAPLREAPNPRILNGPTTVQRPMDAGVPLWVDRAIVVLVVLLVAMILRALLNT